MNTALILAAYLGIGAIVVWVVSRKAARAESELKYAQEYAKRQASSAEIMAKYANLSGDELSECVYKNRETAKQRMRDKDRLD